jgi:hypothetical protein
MPIFAKRNFLKFCGAVSCLTLLLASTTCVDAASRCMYWDSFEKKRGDSI